MSTISPEKPEHWVRYRRVNTMNFLTSPDDSNCNETSVNYFLAIYVAGAWKLRSMKEIGCSGEKKANSGVSKDLKALATAF